MAVIRCTGMGKSAMDDALSRVHRPLRCVSRFRGFRIAGNDHATYCCTVINTDIFLYALTWYAKEQLWGFFMARQECFPLKGN